jgi:hypothetical protein
MSSFRLIVNVSASMALLLPAALSPRAAHAGSDAPAHLAAEESVSFHFRRTEGESVVQTFQLVVEKTVGKDPAHRDEIEARVSGTFHTQAPGYSYVTAPDKPTCRHDGNVVSNPIAELVNGARLTYQLDAQGMARDIKGYGEMETRLQSEYPLDVAARFSKVLPLMAEPTLVENEKADWNGRLEGLSGRTLKIGSVERTTAKVRLPDNLEVDYQVETRIAGWEPCPAGRCVRIALSFGAAGDHVTGTASRLLDPSTLRIYSEQFDRTLSAVITPQGKDPIRISRREQRRYEYSWPGTSGH